MTETRPERRGFKPKTAVGQGLAAGEAGTGGGQAAGTSWHHGALTPLVTRLRVRRLPVLQDNVVPLLEDPRRGQVAVVDPAVAEPVNPFLRCHTPALQTATGKTDPVEVLAELRQRRNQFQGWHNGKTTLLTAPVTNGATRTVWQVRARPCRIGGAGGGSQV